MEVQEDDMEVQEEAVSKVNLTMDKLIILICGVQRVNT